MPECTVGDPHRTRDDWGECMDCAAGFVFDADNSMMCVSCSDM